MLSQINSATLQGLEAIPIKVEVDSFSAGLQPRFTIVGLPDNAVKESQERVFAALRLNGFQLSKRSIVVNLAPADLKKEGTGLDLPITIGVLSSYDTCEFDREMLNHSMFIGELGLDGTVMPIKGALPIAIKARSMGIQNLFVPKENEREAAVVDNVSVYGIRKLNEVTDFLSGQTSLQPTVVNTREEFFANQTNYSLDFADVKGQENVKRAFEVAASGGHNIILVGSPGCGKSMMAKRLPSILPPLSLHESLETTQIHSIAGKLHKDTSLISQRPFRAPHHTVSDVALVGGGNTFMPGEICLAHNGVLFLDELPEFNRSVLETLRQPLEDRVITVSRARYNFTLPCSFMLVASMNPCPCGYHGDALHQCVCTPGQIQRYMNKISGPLLDRIDIQCEVQTVPFAKLSKMKPGESSATIRERVIAARKIQEERFSSLPTGESGGRGRIHCNAQMTEKMLHDFAEPDSQSLEMLRMAMERLKLSARAYNRILKVARTIADLEGSENIQAPHIAEAIGYRNLDRGDWAERGM